MAVFILGAETIVELWLNVPNTVDDHGNDEDGVKSNKSHTSSTVSSEVVQHTVVAPDPKSSTSSQSMAAAVSNNQISNICHGVRIKQEPGGETRPAVVPAVMPAPLSIPVRVKCDKPIATNEQIHSIEHNYPSILTTPNTKIEQSTTQQRIIAGPSKQMSTICNPNTANVLNAGINPTAINPVVAVQPKATTPKRYIKCVSKDGKISLMELVQDESNPKLFKMVLPKGVAGPSTVNLQQSQAMNTVKLVKPPTTPSSMQPIKIGAVLPGTSTGKMPIIRNLMGNSMNLMSKSTPNTPIASLNLSTIHSLSAIPKPKPTQFVNQSNVVVVSTPSTSLPKLVAINSPKTTMASPIINTPSLGSSGQQFPPGTRVIKKNNKILVLDAKQMGQGAQRPKQSLLKPQVSLLKPRPPPPTLIGNSLKRITVSNIPGIEHKNINVFVPNDIGIARTTTTPTKSVFKAKSTSTVRQDFGNQLENRFMARRTFSNMTEAIAWLLKTMPLVSSSAAQDGFRESFPFVVANMAEFYSLHVAKQRSFEVIFDLNSS